jgi:hypothetical protein
MKWTSRLSLSNLATTTGHLLSAFASEEQEEKDADVTNTTGGDIENK